MSGDNLPTSPSVGHLGQDNLFQKLAEASSSPSDVVDFSLMDLDTALQIEGQLKVPKQLGHEKVKGLQS